MRKVIFSTTAKAQIKELLRQGRRHYSATVMTEKKTLLVTSLRNRLFPDAHVRDAELDLYRFPVPRTPFVIFYEVTDTEIAVALVLHRHADRTPFAILETDW